MRKLLSNLLFLLIMASIVIGIHAGYKYGMPHYNAWVFKQNIKELERFSFNNFKGFRERVTKQIQDDKVPIPEKEFNKHVKFLEREGIYTATITWHVPVDYYGYYKKDFKFEVELKKM